MVVTPLVGAATVVVLSDPEGTVVEGIVAGPLDDDVPPGTVVDDEAASSGSEEVLTANVVGLDET